ncbi:MAG: zinc transporter ZupT [Fusobacteriaceae bacterium]
MLSNTFFAFSITLFSALSAMVGCLIGIASKKKIDKLLSPALGFSSGIILYLSFVEIFHEARSNLIKELGDKVGNFFVLAGFFAGIGLVLLIDRFSPHDEECDGSRNSKECLYRMGIFSAIAVGLHNFPEGLSIFISGLRDAKLALPIAFALGIHNLAIGLAISIPIYFSTGSRKKAILYTFISAICSPLGAVIGYFLLLPFLNDIVLGFLYAAVAGIMVFISLDEVLPTAEKYGDHHAVISGVILGMVVISVSMIFI